MSIRIRDKLTTLKIVFYLYHKESATIREIIEDLLKLGLHPLTIRNDLVRLKKLGLVIRENKTYRLDDNIKKELDELVKLTKDKNR